jgi:virginiamycin B lyase
LPDGPGKDEIQAQCTKCHALGLIVNAGGNSRQEWIDLFSTMVKLPNEQRDAIGDYLAKNFPPQPRPQPVVVPGTLSVSFKEWNAPTLGSRPHDP